MVRVYDGIWQMFNFKSGHYKSISCRRLLSFFVWLWLWFFWVCFSLGAALLQEPCTVLGLQTPACDPVSAYQSMVQVWLQTDTHKHKHTPKTPFPQINSEFTETAFLPLTDLSSRRRLLPPDRRSLRWTTQILLSLHQKPPQLETNFWSFGNQYDQQSPVDVTWHKRHKRKT